MLNNSYFNEWTNEQILIPSVSFLIVRAFPCSSIFSMCAHEYFHMRKEGKRISGDTIFQTQKIDHCRELLELKKKKKVKNYLALVHRPILGEKPMICLMESDLIQ